MEMSTPCVLLDEVFLQKIRKPAKGAETLTIRMIRRAADENTPNTSTTREQVGQRRLTHLRCVLVFPLNEAEAARSNYTRALTYRDGWVDSKPAKA